jgi:uncharacterized protein (DUF58 family)
MDRERDRRPSRDTGLSARRRSRSRLRLPRTLQATRAGWCFIAIVFGVGFAALNTGNNLLYLVLSLLLAFLVLSGLLSESSLRGLRVERLLPLELFAETPNRVALRVHNSQTRTPSFAISIEDQVAHDDGTAFAGRAFVLRIGPGESIDRSYSFLPAERGELTFAGCRLSTRFPFGLFVKSVDLDIDSPALVYPRADDPCVAEPDSSALRDGERPSQTSSGGDQLCGVREYAQGDSVKRIQWRRSLRARNLIVGERDRESSAQIEVRLPLPSHLEIAEVETRVARAASLVVQHLTNGYEVGLETNQSRISPKSGFAHRTTLLSFLARVGRDAAVQGDAVLETTEASR